MKSRKEKLLALNEQPADPAAAVPPAVPAAIDPASVVINTPAGPANNTLPAGVVPPAQTLAANNASTALVLVPDQRLTAFAVGYPADDLETMANFLAPQVPAPLKFSYVTHSKANAFGVIQDDIVGINGLPALVQVDPGSTTEATLQFRGLEVQMMSSEEEAFNAVPGGSAEMEWQDRLALVLDWMRRGRLQRIIAAAVASYGAGTGKTWTSNSNNPLSDLDAEITTIAKLAGGRQNVRLAIGATAWNTMKYHKILAGDGTNQKQDPATKQWLADKLEIPVGNIYISYLQVESAKQGKTSSTTDLFTAADVYIFAASQNPNRRDPTFMKTFVMGGGRSVYQYQPHPLISRRGVAYWEKIAVTNAAAVKRLTIS